MEDKRRQELHCHACNRYVQFEIDVSLDGNHVLKCPNCQHEHCRVVRNGVITDTRWDRRNGPPGNGLPIYYIQTTFFSTNSIYDNLGTAAGGAGSAFIANSWADTSSATTGSSAYFGTVVIS
jgi:hypothetical protein